MARNRWTEKLHQESISRAIAAQKLRDEKGWSDGKLMDHFGVVETTVKRWRKIALGLVPEEKQKDGDS